VGGTPKSRTSGLITSELDGELVVYDDDRKLAFRLSRTAAIVWQACDGTRTISDLVEVLSQELGELADEDAVLIALDTLSEHELLESGYERRDVWATRLSRRRFINRVGLVGAAAVAMPVVASLAVPSPAAAASGNSYPPAYYTTA
jgi:hypothetical protein